MINCQTDVLKDFDSRIEKIGLNCLYGNAKGIKFNDLITYGQTLIHLGVLSHAV